MATDKVFSFGSFSDDESAYFQSAPARPDGDKNDNEKSTEKPSLPSSSSSGSSTSTVGKDSYQATPSAITALDAPVSFDANLKGIPLQHYQYPRVDLRPVVGPYPRQNGVARDSRSMQEVFGHVPSPLPNWPQPLGLPAMAVRNSWPVTNGGVFPPVQGAPLAPGMAPRAAMQLAVPAGHHVQGFPVPLQPSYAPPPPPSTVEHSRESFSVPPGLPALPPVVGLAYPPQSSHPAHAPPFASMAPLPVVPIMAQPGHAALQLPSHGQQQGAGTFPIGQLTIPVSSTSVPVMFAGPIRAVADKGEELASQRLSSGASLQVMAAPASQIPSPFESRTSSPTLLQHAHNPNPPTMIATFAPSESTSVAGPPPAAWGIPARTTSPQTIKPAAAVSAMTLVPSNRLPSPLWSVAHAPPPPQPVLPVTQTSITSTPLAPQPAPNSSTSSGSFTSQISTSTTASAEEPVFSLSSASIPSLSDSPGPPPADTQRRPSSTTTSQNLSHSTALNGATSIPPSSSSSEHGEDVDGASAGASLSPTVAGPSTPPALPPKPPVKSWAALVRSSSSSDGPSGISGIRAPASSAPLGSLPIGSSIGQPSKAGKASSSSSPVASSSSAPSTIVLNPAEELLRDGVSAEQRMGANGTSTGASETSLTSQSHQAVTSPLSRESWLNSFKSTEAWGILRIQPRGLLNAGNTCFLNSTLQCLLSCSPFLHLLRILSAETIPSTGYPTLGAFSAFVREFQTLPGDNLAAGGKTASVTAKRNIDVGRPFSPTMFDDVLLRFSPTSNRAGMRNNRQEDAQEFLSFVMDRMHEELLRLEGKSSEFSSGDVGDRGNLVGEGGVVTVMEFDGGEGEEEWETVGPKNRSSVTRTHTVVASALSDIFGGQLRSVVKTKGNKASATVQPFLLLQLDIIPEAVHSLEDALALFAAPESLEGYKTHSGKPEVVTASKAVKIQTLPQILILHLKRFSYGAQGMGKVHKPVQFPASLTLARELLVSATSANSEARKYDLVATVSHHGKDPSGGHYTADVRQYDGRWLRFDDSQVIPIPQSQALHDQAYLLLYKRNVV